MSPDTPAAGTLAESDIEIELIEDHHEEKPISWRRFVGCGCGPIVLVLLILVLLNLGPLFNGRWTVSEETTVLTEPLRPDGNSVDYFAAFERELYPPEMQTDENGVRILVREFGAGIFFDNIEDRELHIADMCEKLGLDPNAVPPMKIIDLGEAIENYRTKHNLERTETNQYYLNFPESPVFEGWLAEMEPALDVVRSAFNSKVFCVPITRTNENETTADLKTGYYFMRIFGLIGMMNNRISTRIANDDLDGAIEDRISITRLVRNLESQWLYINISDPGFLRYIDRIVLVSPSGNYPNEKQLLRLLEAARELPPHIAPAKELLLGRYYILDYIQRIALAEGEPESDNVPIAFAGLLDWKVFMKRFNENWDRHTASYEFPETPNPYSIYLLSGTLRSQMEADKFFNEIYICRHFTESKYTRMQCYNNIREITYAMLLYHERHGSLPPAFSVDSDGRALHSWRVLLLKELGHADIYEKIKLDEPWDSEHNSQFHSLELPVFRCPAFYPSLRPGKTSYTVIIGDNAAFNDSGQGRKFSEFGPGNENLILVTERTEAVNWMRPDMEIEADALIATLEANPPQTLKLEYDFDFPPKPLNLGLSSLGNYHYWTNFNAGFRNGSVRCLGIRSTPETVRAYIEGKELPE